MPVNFLTVEQKAKYGQFPHEPSATSMLLPFGSQSEAENVTHEALQPLNQSLDEIP
jgi:hypothetical protein